MHQLVDDDAQVDAATAQGDGLYPAGFAHTARAAIAGNDVDVGALRCSGDESSDKKTRQVKNKFQDCLHSGLFPTRKVKACFKIAIR